MHLRLELIAEGKEGLDNTLNYRGTNQETIDAVRNALEHTLPDVSAVPQDGEITVIARISVNHEQVFIQKFEKVSKVSLVTLIENPCFDALKGLNTASLG
jgi:hypothetical protein